MRLPFIETVFHILNSNLPQAKEVWPPGSHDINPIDYLKCGVFRRGINRSSHKKQYLITPIMEVFSNIPREAAKRACSCFLSRLEKVVIIFKYFMKVHICFKKRASIPLAPCIL
jgi:hypothetical protein